MERYRYLRENNICASCGKNPTTSAYCDTCKIKNKVSHKKKRCSFDCFNCEFPDCIANPVTILRHQAEIGEVILYVN